MLTPIGDGGTAVCLPSTASGGIPLFAGADCKSPVVLYGNRDDTSAPPTVFDSASTSSRPCPDAVHEIRPVGARVDPSTVCSLYTSGFMLSPGDDIYALGDVIPMSAFATRMGE